MAWRQGDMNQFQRPLQAQHYRPSSPSVTSTSSDDREEVPMVRHPPRRPHSRNRHHHHHHHHQHERAGGFHYPVPSVDHYPHGIHNGTLRSTRSVPALALATWDGEPCPVHGQGPHQHAPHQHGPPFHLSGGMPGTMRRYGSMFDVRGTPVYPPPPSSVLEKKSTHGSMQLLPAGPPFGPMMGPNYPPHFYPPMMRIPGPRQVVIPAGVEALPMRDPYKSRHVHQPQPRLVAKLEEDPYSMDQVCCKGHLIVLWIILGVVTVGVILGIILGVTIA